MPAVSHIEWGTNPQAPQGRTLHNALIGSACTHGASCSGRIFKALFGAAPSAACRPVVGGATIPRQPTS